MTPEHLSKIRAIYEAALSVDDARRSVFLEDICRGEEDLRQEVDLLLHARQHVPHWLNNPVLAAAPTPGSSAHPLPGMMGRRLSGYQVVREIGHGGMGSVYLAERSDGAFHKQVAIKVVRPGSHDAGILARFQQEREILASLDHPGIARLLDAAATEEGLPYFVMEFVDGQPIDRWCDEHKLNVTQRLQLFRSVCAAVQYAHQHLIVHRDLKPGNILVTASGEVKLLDFGIAKLLSHDQTEDEATKTLMLLMTPEYASPEQVNGQTITTLTDVYSLGVILYELLTGHRPYHLLRAAAREMARVLSEEEPTRPSEVVGTTEERVTPEHVSAVREGDPNRLRKRLEGDLDCILLTALRKEPVRRYSSVEAFGEDVSRHLENRPVNAHQDSLLYRVSRFVRRHPSIVVSGILVFVSSAAGFFTTLWESRLLIGVAGHASSARSGLIPLMMLALYIAVVDFGVVAFLARASFIRAMSSLAGGVAFTLVWIIKWRVDFAMGWWRSVFPETPDPILLFSLPILYAAVALFGGIICLMSWRAARRFGWRGQLVFVVAVSLYCGVRDRIWWQSWMEIALAKPGIGFVLADAAFFAAAILLGYASMRLVAGPAHRDQLARTR